MSTDEIDFQRNIAHESEFLCSVIQSGTFPDGRVGVHLQAQTSELEARCAGLSESGAMSRYAEGKWTVKEASLPIGSFGSAAAM